MNDIFDYLLFVERQFDLCFGEKKYTKEQEAKLTSGIDKSVTFVGSSISVLKKYFLEDSIPPNGIYLLQRSIRTRGLQNQKKDQPAEWGSFFTNIGALVSYDKLEKIILDVFDFITKYLSIPACDVMIRINKQDKDLMDAISAVDNDVKREYNTREDVYYRHKYGLQNLGIYGRNFNIALKDVSDGEYKDIGNIIIIENATKKYGVEFGFGSCTFVMRRKGIKSAIQCSKLSKVYEIKNYKELKFADSLLVCSNLMYEDVKKISYPRYSKYYFSKYREAFVFWKNILDYSNKFVIELIQKYLAVEYNDDLITERFDFDYIHKYLKLDGQTKLVADDLFDDKFVKSKIDKIEYLQNKYPMDHGIADHGKMHLFNVLQYSTKLAEFAKLDSCKKDDLIVAVCLHDLGMDKGKKDHAERSYVYAKEFLKNKNIKNKDEILSAIRHHSYPQESDNDLCVILSLADKLDITKTRVGKGGLKIEGMDQVLNIEKLNLEFAFNVLKINYQVNENFDYQKFENFSFYSKIKHCIDSFCKRFDCDKKITFERSKSYENT